VGGNPIQCDDGRCDTFNELSSIAEKSFPKNSTCVPENPLSSIVPHEFIQESKRRPRSNALSTPDADDIAHAMTISGSVSRRGFNVSINQSLHESHDKGLTKSLPELTSVEDVTDDKTVPVSQGKISHKIKAIFSRPKRRSGSYIADDDKYTLWQCAGCHQLNESDKLNCKGCGGHAGVEAIAESLCKGCKIKVYFSDIERLRSDSSCPMCEMPLGNTQLSSNKEDIKKQK